jgi:hypothetical protein
METIQIELKIPGGELATGSDPAAFEREVTNALSSLKTTYVTLKPEAPKEKAAPAGSAGVHEAILWVLHHHEDIHNALMLLKDLIATSSAAALAYMKIRNDGAKGKDAGVQRSSLTLTAGNASLQLPAADEEKTAFLSKVEGLLKQKK